MRAELHDEVHHPTDSDAVTRYFSGRARHALLKMAEIADRHQDFESAHRARFAITVLDDGHPASPTPSLNEMKAAVIREQDRSLEELIERGRKAGGR